MGGGPSVKDMDLLPLKHHRTIGVNDAFKLLPFIDITWFTDCQWYKWNAEALQSFGGLIVGAPRCCCNHSRVLQLRRLDSSGITTNPEQVKWNKSSGASAINLAVLLGAKKVFLIGFDMQVKDGNHNWHTNHFHKPRTEIYRDLFLDPFTQIAEDAEKLQVQIFNATSDSALKIFPFVDLKEVLK